MNDQKITVGILFGGKSAEHEVSLQSAKNIYEAIDRSRFEPTLIGIDKGGKWLLCDASRFLLNSGDPRAISLDLSGSPVALTPASQGLLSALQCGNAAPPLTPIPHSSFLIPHLDVVFPILHGPFGEDGTVQGLLKLAGIPFVGTDVLGSAVGMDKDVMKRLFRDAGIPIGKFLTFMSHNTIPPFAEIQAALGGTALGGAAPGNPVFVKPANSGSSVGINKARNEAEFSAAVNEAFKHDAKIVIEECIAGREIECAVLGNADPVASVPGEVIPTHEFYSYEAKYLDENGAALEIPAKLDEKTRKRIQELSIKAFQVLCCAGLSRVDFFLKKNGEVVINEINTMPGFTKNSMYPKLWEASGIGYTELISRLIELAMEKQ